MTGRSGRLRRTLPAAVTALVVGSGVWWWHAAAPGDGGSARGPGVPVVDHLFEGPVERDVRSRRSEWVGVLDELVPLAGTLANGAHTTFGPSSGWIDLAPGPVGAGAYQLEVACVGRGEVTLTARGGTRLDLTMGCTEQGEYRSVSEFRVQGRFSLRASAGPESEGALGYRLTPHAAVDEWREVAEHLLPSSAEGVVSAGGGMLVGLEALRAHHEAVGAGRYWVAVVCVGHGEVRLRAGGAEGRGSSVPVECGEWRPLRVFEPETRLARRVGGDGLEIVLESGGDTLSWVRYLVIAR